MNGAIQEIHLPLQALDYVGVALFAISGALAAARQKHDVITFAVFSVITGMGGGTLRDLLIGAPKAPRTDAANRLTRTARRPRSGASEVMVVRPGVVALRAAVSGALRV